MDSGHYRLTCYWERTVVAGCNSRQEVELNRESRVLLQPIFQTESDLQTSAAEYHTSTYTEHRQTTFTLIRKYWFLVAASRAWNGLPASVRTAASLTTFRQQLKTVFYRPCFC